MILNEGSKQYDIDCNNADKRIRVFSFQLADTILDNTTLSNFGWSLDFYVKQGMKLIKRFPNRTDEIIESVNLFSHEMGDKYILLKNEELCRIS